MSSHDMFPSLGFVSLKSISSALITEEGVIDGHSLREIQWHAPLTSGELVQDLIDPTILQPKSVLTAYGS